MDKLIEDKCLFESNTKYTENEYLKFYKIYLQVIYRYIHIAIYFICNLMISIQLYFNDNNIFFKIGILGIIVYTILLFSYPYIYRKVKKPKKITVYYRFYDKYFEVSQEENGNYSKVEYRKLYRVYESKKNLYLFIDRNHAYILNKKKLNKFTKVFVNSLKKKLKSKYVKLI